MTKYSLVFFALTVLSACAAPPIQSKATLPPPSAVPAVATLTLAPAKTPTPSPTLTRPSPTAFVTAPSPNDAALVPVLMYHHIKDLGPGASELDLTWTVAPKNFQAQMDFLVQQHYKTISVAQLGAYLRLRTPLPSKPIIVSIDDGWVEGYSVAFPALRKNGFVATYFVYTQPVDRSPAYLSWKQIGEMSVNGMDFQGHTITHPHLTLLSVDDAMREISDSKKTLETRLNKPVISFSYPFGQFNNAVVDLVKRAGYESAFTIDPGYRQRADRIFMLQRIRVTYTDTLQSLLLKLPP